MQSTKGTHSDSNYAYKRTVNMSFEQTIAKTRQALAAEGFGVLCEIDLKEKLKEKLGVDFRKYVILGACNPPLAYRSLQEELNVGLLLPCNVVVYEKDGDSVVAAIDASRMLSVIDNPRLESVAAEVNDKLRRVVDNV